MARFEDFKLNKQLLSAVEDMGYSEPSLIQKKAIPMILAGHDVLGIAQTGTGKTAAFILPLLMKVKYAQGTHPRALILAPTRELVIQINDDIRQLSAYCDIRHIGIFGGAGMKAQAEAIQKGLDVLVATPGRLMDLYAKGYLVLKNIKTLVLDEADKMMDMGFMPQIRQILEIIPVKRQNLLFSATMPEKVLTLSEEFLEFPERVEVAPQATTVDTVEQYAYLLPNFKTKINLLELLLKDDKVFNRVIIFTKSKQTANNIYKFLSRKAEGEVRVIHGNKDQNARINAMEAFKQGKVRILVSTDVSARGIDISMVSHVINFDVPLIYEDYVHRIGRTGRAQNTGTAITFITPADQYHIKKIENIIRQKIPVKVLPHDLTIEETSFPEEQEMKRIIDVQKRKENPDYKGAFHEKKSKNKKGDRFQKKSVKNFKKIKGRR